MQVLNANDLIGFSPELTSDWAISIQGISLDATPGFKSFIPISCEYPITMLVQNMDDYGKPSYEIDRNNQDITFDIYLDDKHQVEERLTEWMESQYNKSTGRTVVTSRLQSGSGPVRQVWFYKYSPSDSSAQIEYLASLLKSTIPTPISVGSDLDSMELVKSFRCRIKSIDPYSGSASSDLRTMKVVLSVEKVSGF